MNFKVTVIIPIYNVEKFIKRCVISLFEQSLNEVQFIFVDDCSPDNSVAILHDLINEYEARKAHVQIIRHEINQGLASARNSGLLYASGEYIYHCDSDDWVEKDGLEALYNKAILDNSDIVWSDWYLSFLKNERYMSQAPVESAFYNQIDILKQLLGGRLKYNVWNKLIKRTLYIDNGIYFPDGYSMGEDMTMIKLFACANKISYLPVGVYHYVQLNNEAYTKKKSENHFSQIKMNVDIVVKFLEAIYHDQLKESIHFFKLNVKLPFLLSCDVTSYERWNTWFVESNSFIDKNPLFKWRIRMIQKLALKRQYFVLKIYNFIIQKVFYGIIYK